MINNVNTQEIVDFALKNFPADLQLDILQEECAELIKALSKYKRENYPNNMTDFKSDSETRNNVIEEMSHVLISIDVVSSIVKISGSEIQDEINKKVQKYCSTCEMANKDNIKSTIIKALETASNHEIAQAYSHIICCVDCKYRYKCQIDDSCYYFILDKLEGDDGKEN